MFKTYPRHSILFGGDLLSAGLRALFGRVGDDKIGLFENEFAKFIGTKHALAVPSARVGLYLGLRALGLPDGAEVIMPAYAFRGMASAVKAAGLRPVFVDIADTGFNIDEDRIEASISPRTRALLVCHMFGVPCEMDAIARVAQKHRLDIIEDCAHACGSAYRDKRTGSFGRFALFSFGMGKNIACLGGGMVATDDEDLYRSLAKEISRRDAATPVVLFAEMVKTFLVSCLTRQPLFSLLTFPALFVAGLFDINYVDRKCNADAGSKAFQRAVARQRRFSPAQAALGSRQLADLELRNGIVMRHADRYDALLGAGVRPGPDLNDKRRTAVRCYYMIRVRDRDAFRRRMLLKGIDTKAGDMCDCSQDIEFGGRPGRSPNAGRAAREIVEIPSGPALGERDREYIACAVNANILK